MYSVKTTLQYAATQLKRNLRDPITTIVLFGIPVLLLLIFGSLSRGTVSVDVALINHSETELAKTFEAALGQVKALKISDEQSTLDEAREDMKSGSIDGIIEIPESFGKMQDGAPAGTAKVYYDQINATAGDIVGGIVSSVADGVNAKIVQVTMPIAIERTSLTAALASPFDGIYAIFTGMTVMMVGIFAVGSVFPTDKKSGVLRRLRVTPIKAREVILGTMLSWAIIGILGVALLTILAMVLFGFTMRGDWGTYGVFMLVALVTMLGFGLMVGSIAKNSTQADIIGQIIFMISLSVSGVWFPRALLPEFLQSITFFFPLTPVIDGIRAITAEGVNIAALLPEIGVLLGWCIVVYGLGIRLFKWSQ